MNNFKFVGIEGYDVKVGSCANTDGNFTFSRLTVDFGVGSDKKGGMTIEDFQPILDALIKLCDQLTTSRFIDSRNK